MLHFQASDYRTKVWVNGTFIGRHDGGYAAFSFDITGVLLNDGSEQRIAVKIEDSMSCYQPWGKQVQSEEEFLRRYKEITQAIKDVPYICGYCYTQMYSRRSTVC